PRQIAVLSAGAKPWRCAKEPGPVELLAWVRMAAEGRARLDGQSRFANLGAAWSNSLHGLPRFFFSALFPRSRKRNLLPRKEKLPHPPSTFKARLNTRKTSCSPLPDSNQACASVLPK
ncbi:MAG: hypothetical protein ACLQGT_01000, partial [Terracidiphilus sp.]